MLPPMPPLPFDAALEAEDLGLVVRFGSRSRGTARPDSDLDLGVLHKDGARLAHRELGELRLRLEDRFGLQVDVVDLRSADALLRREAILDGEVLHASSRTEWTELVERTLIEIDDLGPMLDACVEGVMRAARVVAS